MLWADDLDIAPDFFEYFLATHPILHSDPTLWCVSAWNDNGKDSLVAYEPGKYSNQIVIKLNLGSWNEITFELTKFT